ncbi:AAA family ATPase [Pandoraea apista]|uniref:AAA family ATPase n=1 Tax=Pandoraea apista TaxID=93218 RepID=UPI00248ED090|nr:AAA family ATPase [Pandoraea apista]
MPIDSRFLILLSGPVAVGKTTLRDFLSSEHGFCVVRSSSFLLEKAQREGGAVDRKGLQELGDRMDAETDYRWIVDDVALPSMNASPGKLRWLVDAVRKRKQVEHFRRLAGTRVLHVHMTASEELLRERYEVRRADDSIGGKAIEYDAVVAHPNEVASRGLIEIADAVFDVSGLTTAEIAEQLIAQESR